MFWVSLIVAAPGWNESDNYRISTGQYTRAQSDECIALYIIAMESWVRPQCAHLGANTSLYGSIIFNVFLMYCVFRWIFRKLQDRVISWRTPSIGEGAKTFWNKAGDIALMLAYNRPCMSVAIGYTLTLFTFMSGILVLYALDMPWKNAITYAPYFLLGLSAANLVECLQWALWNQHISLDSWTENDLLPSSRTLNPGIYCPHVYLVYIAFNCCVALQRQLADSFLQKALVIFWRFSPDIIAILCGLLMSTDGPYGHRVANLSTWWGVPGIVVAFIVVCSLQRGDSRKNLSRLFLQSPPMNLLGYISYPTCNAAAPPILHCLTELQIYFSEFLSNTTHLSTQMTS